MEESKFFKYQLARELGVLKYISDMNRAVTATELDEKFSRRTPVNGEDHWAITRRAIWSLCAQGRIERTPNGFVLK